ncbi:MULTISPECIES: D-lactate dehydrogenase [unclassified Sphingomonas]|uniref:D-lactate dehydrogenase n=1 Tax=unclassified Sphingomonas TaxID=196159 RepID=UPI0006F8BB14|nr:MULTISPECIES: D-lactate dehydrogenase [unclassified Sphingomonas]KQX23501.1 lactate dehydrogenase [Sphingomonas sp. Root1294]KQY68351.1 lactate dehydrogenase [Sphingomonas sp. Root50]KRB91254.1 lactate dehydrogenase [Sphingomonas sp. Root720]
MAEHHASCLADLRQMVGARHVLTGDRETSRYRTGYRFGGGPVLAVVMPGSLVEQWRVALRCRAADIVMIVQAANTGLTGGSTPRAEGYDRPVVIISTRRIKGVRLIRDGDQAICLAGATLYELEGALSRIGRQPHSVIGSSCIGASVVGGVCNNSGGALVQRGPAYTEWALYARVEADGRLALVNQLGIDLGDDPEEMLARLEEERYDPADIRDDAGRQASDTGYAAHVRKIDEPTPARFNADPGRLYDVSGSAGHLIVFAVRLDTFPDDGDSATFYVGTNDPAVFTSLRRDMLAEFAALPVTGEYIHRTAFDIAAVYGKDVFLAIERLGTQRLPALFAARAWVDAFTARIGLGGIHLSDRVLQAASRLFPQHLPARMRAFRDRFEHHLILKMAGAGVEEARRYFADRLDHAHSGMFECTADEARKAYLHRFAVAGAAVRYRAVHSREIADIVALDIALPRNTTDWVEQLPAKLDGRIAHKLYYGHFFCQVFHQDYLVAAGHDPHALEREMLTLLDARGAEYPAEHNVGHLYPAKPTLAAFYQALDPCNALNPGIGQTSACSDWR